jgi:propionyl-CoA carboxylase beta chain
MIPDHHRQEKADTIDMNADDGTERLRQLRKEARQSGGPHRIVARRRQGARTARERVLGLLDPGTFIELDVFVKGAVTGHGRIEGRDVYVFSQDGEAPREHLGQPFARKIAKVIDLALKNGAPLIGFYDCGYSQDQAGDPALADEERAGLGSYAELYFRNVMASGLVPQISAIVGPCTGSAIFSPALMDFVIMVKGSGQLYLSASKGDDGQAETDVSLEELGGARSHAELSGLAHLAASDEAECVEMIRDLLSYLPQNNLEEPPRNSRLDPVDRMDEALEGLAGADRAQYDVRDLVSRIVDEKEFFELSPGWARNVVTGFAHLGGRCVGIVGNQPAHLDGSLDGEAARKAARFVRFCDAFNVPLVTLVDTRGFLGGKQREHQGVIRSAAQLMYAYCEATVPKITLITRAAYGEAREVMGSKQLRADFNFAWPSAGIALVPPEGALDRQDAASPYEAAAQGLLDDVIEPAETRPRLIAALDACASKREGRPPKKHGNIPL